MEETLEPQTLFVSAEALLAKVCCSEIRTKRPKIDEGQLQGDCRRESERRQVRSDQDDFLNPCYWDPLTGVYNRIFFDEHLQDHFLDDSALGRPTSVIYCEISGVKISSGHSGDTTAALLERAARLIETQTRKTDKIVRFGSDLFALVLPETDAETTRMICSRLQKVLAELQTDPKQSRKAAIRISLGTATDGGHTRYNCLNSLCYAASTARAQVHLPR